MLQFYTIIYVAGYLYQLCNRFRAMIYDTTKHENRSLVFSFRKSPFVSFFAGRMTDVFRIRFTHPIVIDSFLWRFL